MFQAENVRYVFALNKNVKSKKVAAYCFDKSKNIFLHIRMPLVLVHAGLVARHNAHCLVLTADRSKIRPFKSMVKLLHTRNFKQPL